MRGAAFVSLLVLVVACGVDGPEPTPKADPPVAPAGGGDGTPTGGAGDTPPPSGDAGGGAPSDGGVTPGGGAGTGGTGGGSDGGGTGAGSVDPSVVIARTDQHAECDGLLPTSAPKPVVIEVEPGAYGNGCGGRGISEGGGHVAIVSQAGGGWWEWQVYSPDGTRAQRFTVHSRLLPQPDGWLGARAGARLSPFGSVQLLAFAGDGAPRRSEEHSTPGEAFSMHGWALAEDPLGGALLVHESHTTDGTATCRSEFIRYDAEGNRVSTATDVACTHRAVGVSNRGEALVVGNESDQSFVTWLERDGRVAVERTPAAPNDGDFGEAFPLLDGSLAVTRSWLDWSRRFERLATASGPAPAWLAERRGATFRFTRGNRGYAVFPRDDLESSDCSVAIELLAPSGRRCGTVTLLSDGTSCTTAPVDQGWDGTVVQKVRADRCTHRWWPRLLAGD
jgi:hypothetical protein